MLGAVKAALASRGESPGERAEELVSLTLKVDQEDAWIWQATKTLMEVALDTPSLDERAGALLGETMSTLMNALPSPRTRTASASAVTSAASTRGGSPRPASMGGSAG